MSRLRTRRSPQTHAQAGREQAADVVPARIDERQASGFPGGPFLRSLFLPVDTSREVILGCEQRFGWQHSHAIPKPDGEAVQLNDEARWEGILDFDVRALSRGRTQVRIASGDQHDRDRFLALAVVNLQRDGDAGQIHFEKRGRSVLLRNVDVHSQVLAHVPLELEMLSKNRIGITEGIGPHPSKSCQLVHTEYACFRVNEAA